MSGTVVDVDVGDTGIETHCAESPCMDSCTQRMGVDPTVLDQAVEEDGAGGREPHDHIIGQDSRRYSMM